MKKNILVIIFQILLTVVLSCFARPVCAVTMANGKNDRMGFFLGIAPGGGWLHYRSGGPFNRLSPLGDIKIGGGITENIILMLEDSFAYSKINGVNLTINNIMFALQWFSPTHFYLRPAIGLNVARFSARSNGVRFSETSDVSGAVQLVGGREFRFGKGFSLSPELRYTYSHIRDSLWPNDHAHILGVQASVAWYF